ncbi:MAG: hypothetical protein JXA33_25010 [Anaerolineae bacterium]|nr:hypothetical protein [Anaerolineae bacterium]
MWKFKLVVVEGIPGSGKTTTARFVCDWLEERGQQPILFLEGDWDHPADFESVACLDEQEYTTLQDQFPKHAAFLAEHARREDDAWFFSYRKLHHELGEQMSDALFEALARFEIYDLPAEKHQRLLLQRWRNFVSRAVAEDIIYVFECCFLQNPLTTLLARHNLPTDAVYRHVLALAEIVLPLRPKLIYLAQNNARATLETIREQRPQEWADFVTWYLTGQAYGKAHGLSGWKGVADFYTIRQALELEFLQRLPLASLVLSDRDDWDARYRHLAAWFEGD